MPDVPPDLRQGRLDEARAIFETYLDRHKQRKTPERFAILEEIYNRSDHFDVESLFIHMKQKNYRVSRATVYNTLDLLVDSGLVKRHQFGLAQALYEKSYGYKQHDHAICQDCQRVMEFCDPRIGEIERLVGEMLGLDIQLRALTMYGRCTKLACEHRPAGEGSRG